METVDGVTRGLIQPAENDTGEERNEDSIGCPSQAVGARIAGGSHIQRNSLHPTSAHRRAKVVDRSLVIAVAGCGWSFRCRPWHG